MRSPIIPATVMANRHGYSISYPQIRAFYSPGFPFRQFHVRICCKKRLHMYTLFPEIAHSTGFTANGAFYTDM